MRGIKTTTPPEAHYMFTVKKRKMGGYPQKQELARE